MISSVVSLQPMETARCDNIHVRISKAIIANSKFRRLGVNSIVNSHRNCFGINITGSDQASVREDGLEFGHFVEIEVGLLRMMVEQDKWTICDLMEATKAEYLMAILPDASEVEEDLDLNERLISCLEGIGFRSPRLALSSNRLPAVSFVFVRP